jgi:hypothetical protein
MDDSRWTATQLLAVVIAEHPDAGRKQGAQERCGCDPIISCHSDGAEAEMLQGQVVSGRHIACQQAVSSTAAAAAVCL